MARNARSQQKWHAVSASRCELYQERDRDENCEEQQRGDLRFRGDEGSTHVLSPVLGQCDHWGNGRAEPNGTLIYPSRDTRTRPEPIDFRRCLRALGSDHIGEHSPRRNWGEGSGCRFAPDAFLPAPVSVSLRGVERSAGRDPQVSGDVARMPCAGRPLALRPVPLDRGWLLRGPSWVRCD